MNHLLCLKIIIKSATNLDFVRLGVNVYPSLTLLLVVINLSTKYHKISTSVDDCVKSDCLKSDIILRILSFSK